jgi:hypothetical protein
MFRVALLLAILANSATTEGAEPVDYLKQVKPILAARCAFCHGALKQEGSLRLDTAGLMRSGGDSGQAIVPGDSAASLLIHAVTGTGDVSQMPQEGDPLKPEEIDLLRRWIDQGAKAPEEKTPDDPRGHWAFQPPVRPQVPHLSASRDIRNWQTNPIDAFIAADHQSRGLEAMPAAEKEVLLRRVYLDLVGLPPTSDQLRAFLDDDSPGAYDKVVDQLLASPRYGERWGRHFMDVWRYSDWAGYRQEVRSSQPHIWRWRDWIVESLNADKPYDQMIREMLAADELAPTDADALRATGYLVRNWYKYNRNVWLQDTVDHTAKAFMGFTLACARCHDHMYDPVSQQEYFQFRAIFEPHNIRTDRVPGQADTAKDGLVRVFDADAAAKTYLFVRGNEAEPHKDQPLEAAAPAILGGKLTIEPVELPAEAYYPGLAEFVRHDLREAAQADVAKADVALSAARKAVAALEENSQGTKQHAAAQLAEKQLAAAIAQLDSLQARIMADEAHHASPPAANSDELANSACRLERQANLLKAEAELMQAESQLADAKSAPQQDDAKVKKAVAAAETAAKTAQKQYDEAVELSKKDVDGKYSPLTQVGPSTSTGRRAALARWITDRQHPLTARVAVNHVWLRHFGKALVPSVFDFGTNGQRPTHPELLDWLAVELMDSGWRLKRLHRLIVTSQTYRLASTADEQSANLAIDADNAYLWRMNSRRVEAEIVRDSVLAAAGELDLSVGGPEIDQSQGEISKRRSIYFRHAHEKQMPFLKLFDPPSVTECYRRDESVVPQQALALANSKLALEQSRVLAGKLVTQLAERSGDARGLNEHFVDAAFEQTLTRLPTPAERSECLKFLDQQADRLANAKQLTSFAESGQAKIQPAADPAQRARENLVHVLLNHHEFVTIR